MRTIYITIALLLASLQQLCSATGSRERIEERIYLDSAGGVHFTESATKADYEIVNWKELSIVPGMARFSFAIHGEKHRYIAKLSNYEHLPDPPQPNIRGSYQPPMFGKLNRVAFLRLSAPEDFSYCFTMDMAKRFVHMLSISIMLHTGYQASLDESDCFISKACVPVNQSCYDSGRPCLLNDISSEVAAGKEVGFNRNFASIIYFAHWACSHTGWVGLAAISNNDAWVNKGNYWTIARSWYNPPDDPKNSNYGTFVHEVHHNMGFNHANTGDANTVGFIKNLTYVNGYNDNANFMGWGGGWWMVPAPNTWTRNIARENILTRWFRQTMDGEHIYRLLPWDHPLSRLYLGATEPAFNDTDVIRSIEYRFHAIALSFPFGRQFYNKFVDDYAEVNLTMYYRSVSAGQNSYQNQGVTFSLGRIERKNGGGNLAGTGSNVLHIFNDDITHWGASLLPLGYLSMPELDTGTLSFQVLRFRRHINQNENISLAENPPTKINLDDIPYVEILINQLPNVPFVAPSVKKKLDLEFSPALANCAYLENSDTEIKCDRFTTLGIHWAYVKGGPNSCREGNRNIPRMYHVDGALIGRGRAAVNSYRGSGLFPFQVKCGRKDTEIVRTAIVRDSQISSAIGKVVDYSNCLVFDRKATSKDDNDFKPYPSEATASKRWDAVVVQSFTPPENGEVYLTDLYLNKKSMDRMGNSAIQLLERFEVQSFTDGVVVVRNKTRVYGTSFFYRFRTDPTQRVAVLEYNDNTKTFQVGPADRPSLFTVPTILERTTFPPAQWHYFVFTRIELSDFIFFDFAGIIPSNLVLYLETDNGIHMERLWYMAGLTDISLRIAFYSIHLNTGGSSEVYRFQFNKEVTLESIRPMTISRYSNLPDKRGTGNFSENVGNQTFRFSCLGSTSNFEFSEFQASFKGERFSFTKETDVFEIKVDAMKDPEDSAHMFSLVFVAMIILVLL